MTLEIQETTAQTVCKGKMNKPSQTQHNKSYIVGFVYHGIMKLGAKAVQAQPIVNVCLDSIIQPTIMAAATAPDEQDSRHHISSNNHERGNFVSFAK